MQESARLPILFVVTRCRLRWAGDIPRVRRSSSRTCGGNFKDGPSAGVTYYFSVASLYREEESDLTQR
jgi:hypothetical protein